MAISKEYNELLAEANSRRKMIKKVFNNLKKNHLNKKINDLFRMLHQEVFNEIDCLKCANCCSTISPMISDHDIQKMSRALKLKPSVVSNQYLKIDKDHDYVYKTLPCPYLDPGNLCKIYNFRPKACREYPHTDHPKVTNILDITFKNTFVCPAVYLIIKKIEVKII